MSVPSACKLDLLEVERELVKVVRQLRFCAVDGGFAAGRLVHVKVVPLGKPREEAYRLQVSLHPSDPLACPVDGWRLCLRYVDRDADRQVVALTNHRGEATFNAMVPALAQCSLELRTAGFAQILEALQQRLGGEAPEPEPVRPRVKAPAAHTRGAVPEVGPAGSGAAARRGSVAWIRLPQGGELPFEVGYDELPSSAGRGSLLVHIGRLSPGRQRGESLRWALRQGDTFWLPNEQSEVGGDFRFDDLPAGEFLLHWERDRPRPVRVLGVVQASGRLILGSRKRATVEGARRAGGARGRGVRRYQIVDLKLSATLAEGARGGCTLIVSSADPKLAKARIRFAFAGVAAGVVALSRRAAAGFSGSVSMKCPFSDLAEVLPIFRVLSRPSA